MDIDKRLEFLVQSQESLGRNIEKLYENVSELANTTRQNSEELQRFRRAMQAALQSWLEGGSSQTDAR